VNPTSSNTSSADPEIHRQYAERKAAQQPPPVQGPRMVQRNRQQQDTVRDASRVKQIEQLAAIPVAEEGPDGFFIPWDDGKPKWDFAGKLRYLSGSDSSGEADPYSGYEPDPESDVSEAADASSSAAASGGDSGNSDVAGGRTDLLPLLFKQVVSSNRGRGEYAEEFGASDEDSGDSLYAGDAGSGSEPVSEDEGDSGDASDQGSISSAGESDDESSFAASTDVPDNESDGTGDSGSVSEDEGDSGDASDQGSISSAGESDDESGSAASTDVPDNESDGTGDTETDENHLDAFNSSNQCRTLKARRSDSKTCSDTEQNAGEHDAALAFAENPQSSQQLTLSRQFRPWDSLRHSRDARSDSEDAFSDSQGNADAPPGVAPFFGKGSDSFGGQADSFDAQQNRFRLPTNEQSDALGDESLSSLGYSETTEESSTDPEDDLGPELRADILEEIAEANRKAKEEWDLRRAENEKRALRSFEGNGFRVSVDIPVSWSGEMFLEFKGKLEKKYFPSLVEAVQEKLVLSSSLTITTKDQEGCVSASEFIRRAPQSLLDSITELKFSLDQDPAFFLDAHSLGKLLPAIRTLEAPSSVVPTLLKRCRKPMARLSKLVLNLYGSYSPSTGKWLAQHSHLKNLSIMDCSFFAEEASVAYPVEPLLLALERNTSVQRLSLSVPCDENKEAIVGLIKNNAGIRRLSLQHQHLEGQAGAEIIQSLHLRRRLEELKIYFSGLDVWTALAGLIASPSCPREVTLNEMNFSDELDMMRIISGLAENSNLEVLNWDSHHFSRQTVPSFVKMVESHPTLKGIRVESRQFSRDDVEKIKRALDRNRGISVAAPAATAALQILAGRNYPREFIHQIIEQISTLSPQGKEDGLQTLVNLQDAVLQPGPRS
jgi:hypothetical protein